MCTNKCSRVCLCVILTTFILVWFRLVWLKKAFSMSINKNLVFVCEHMVFITLDSPVDFLVNWNILELKRAIE